MPAVATLSIKDYPSLQIDRPAMFLCPVTTIPGLPSGSGSGSGLLPNPLFCALQGDSINVYVPRADTLFLQATQDQILNTFMRLIIEFSFFIPTANFADTPQIPFLPPACMPGQSPAPGTLCTPIPTAIPVVKSRYFTHPRDAIVMPGVQSFNLASLFKAAPLAIDKVIPAPGGTGFIGQWNPTLPGDLPLPGQSQDPSLAKRVYFDFTQPPWNQDPVIALWAGLDPKPPLYMYYGAQALNAFEGTDWACGTWLVQPSSVPVGLTRVQLKECYAVPGS